MVDGVDEAADVGLEAVDARDDDRVLEAQAVGDLRGDQLLQHDPGVRRGRDRNRRGGSGVRAGRVGGGDAGDRGPGGGEDPRVPSAAQRRQEQVVLRQAGECRGERIRHVLDPGGTVLLHVQPRPALALEADGAVLDVHGLPRAQAAHSGDGRLPAQRRTGGQDVRPRVPVRAHRGARGEREQPAGEAGGGAVVRDVDRHGAGDPAQQLLAVARAADDEGVGPACGVRVLQVGGVERARGPREGRGVEAHGGAVDERIVVPVRAQRAHDVPHVRVDRRGGVRARTVGAHALVRPRPRPSTRLAVERTRRRFARSSIRASAIARTKSWASTFQFRWVRAKS